jgi:hypothetical protein
MSKAAAKKHKWNVFLLGTDYGIRRTKKREWYVWKVTRDGAIWVKADKQEIQNHLAVVHNLAPYSEEGGVTDVDWAMDDVLSNFTVEYAGAFAGYREPGEYLIQGERVLVTQGVALIELVKGDCEWLKEVYRRSYPRSHSITIRGGGDDGRVVTLSQHDAVFGWIQGMVRALYLGEPPNWPGHGQALVLLGESGLGKTSHQQLFTAMFGGRATDPELFFKDRTAFNEQLLEKEHWKMSDPKSKSRAEQESILGEVKKHVANVYIPGHAKGAKIIDVPTLRRISIALNPDSSGLKILRDMAPSELDKFLIVNLEHAGAYKPDGQEWGGLSWEEWYKKALSELPAFLYWILYEYEVPVGMRDVRYNVVYRNPDVEPEIAAPTDQEVETELQNIVGIGVFTDIYGATAQATIEGPVRTDASGVVDRVLHAKSPVLARARQHSDIFKSNATRLGNLLAKWAGPPGKVEPCGPATIQRFRLPRDRSEYEFTKSGGVMSSLERIKSALRKKSEEAPPGECAG